MPRLPLLQTENGQCREQEEAQRGCRVLKVLTSGSTHGIDLIFWFLIQLKFSVWDFFCLLLFCFGVSIIIFRGFFSVFFFIFFPFLEMLQVKKKKNKQK